MRSKQSFLLLGFIFALAIIGGIFLGLGRTPVSSEQGEPKQTEAQPVFLDGTYHELGQVLILEYHRVGPQEDRWTRSITNFKKDLERLYQSGYRLVQVRDFFDRNHVEIPKGKKPLLLSFDDATLEQLKFQEDETGAIVRDREGKAQLDPNCAVAILDAFYEQHPDFGRAATFYLNFPPFKQGKNYQAVSREKLQYLLSTGRDIGNHTVSHVKLSELTPKGIQKALGQAVKATRELTGNPSFEVTSLALPFGLFPKSMAGEQALLAGSYQNTQYRNTNVLLVGAGPALPPYARSFDPLRIQRVQAIQEELDKWLPYYEKFPKLYYVSDGDPETITIQQEDRKKIKKHKITPGKMLRICDGKKVIQTETILSKAEKLKKKTTADKGIYLTYHSASNPGLLASILAKIKGTELNTLVVDIKDRFSKAVLPKAGAVPQPISETHPTFLWLKKLTEKLHAEGIRVSTRIVIFLDHRLAYVRPDLMIRNKNNGGIWRDQAGAPWADPYSEEAVRYNLLIAEAAARAGVDEVQFDYIRFPTDGNTHLMRFPHNQAGSSRKEAIENFLWEAVDTLEPYNVSLAIDIFGVVAWEAEADVRNLGQEVRMIAEYVDVLCPMLYPSHFHNGYDGVSYPGDAPEYFIKTGCLKLRKILGDSAVRIVPWIQGFTWRTNIFGPSYILKQRKAAFASGSPGYLVWNAGNEYSAVWQALKAGLPGEKETFMKKSQALLD